MNARRASSKDKKETEHGKDWKELKDFKAARNEYVKIRREEGEGY